MRVTRLASGIVALAALVSIPANAVVDLRDKAEQQKPVYLTYDGSSAADTGSNKIRTFSFPSLNISSSASNSGSVPWPSSGSSMAQIPGVPELSTWWMLVMGFFLIGTVRYRAVRVSRARSE
jgi:hypothetical protein